MPTTSENGIHPGYMGREKSTKHNCNKTQSAAKGTIMGNERQHRRKDVDPPGCPKVRCGLLSKDLNKIIFTGWSNGKSSGKQAFERKNAKSQDLLHHCRGKGWQAGLFPVEVSGG